MEEKIFHASISNIILRSDNKKFNQKRQEINTPIKELWKENNIYLIDNTSKIKGQHLNKGKLHLNKRGYNIRSCTFISKLSRIWNWQLNKNNAGFNVEKCNFDETNVDQKFTGDNRVMKSLCCTNLKKLVFTHLNINSIRNNFELISEQFISNIEVLMVSETKTDDSFLIENF